MTITKLKSQKLELWSGKLKRVTIDVFDRDNNPIKLNGTGRLLIGLTDAAKPMIVKEAKLPPAPKNRMEFVIHPTDTERLHGEWFWRVKYIDRQGRSAIVAFGLVTIKVAFAE